MEPASLGKKEVIKRQIKNPQEQKSALIYKRKKASEEGKHSIIEKILCNCLVL